MTGKTHLTFGLGTGIGAVAFMSVTEPVTAGVIVGAAALGSLLPDLDSPNSTISNVCPLPLHWFFRHRGILHSILIPVLMIVIGAAFEPQLRGYVYAIGMGITSHLILDAMTIHGIKLLPLHWRIYLLPKPLRVRTGGLSESIFVLLAVGAALVIALQHHPHVAHDISARLSDIVNGMGF